MLVCVAIYETFVVPLVFAASFTLARRAARPLVSQRLLDEFTVYGQHNPSFCAAIHSTAWTELASVLYRFLGVRVGKGVAVAGFAPIASPEAVSIHSGVVFGGTCEVAATRSESITICQNALLANSAVISGGVEVGAGCTVGNRTFIEADKTCPPNTVYIGSPASGFRSKAATISKFAQDAKAGHVFGSLQYIRNGFAKMLYWGVHLLAAGCVHLLVLHAYAGALC